MYVVTMNQIKKFLEDTGLTRAQFIHLLEKEGWAPSESALSRWINDDRTPDGAARVLIKRATNGRVDYDGNSES